MHQADIVSWDFVISWYGIAFPGLIHFGLAVEFLHPSFSKHFITLSLKSS
jgi:hypothetical protein